MKEAILNNEQRLALHREHIKKHFCTINCISWTAIIMGAIFAVSIGFLLNLLGLALGLSAFPTEANGQAAFGVAGFIGLVVIAFLTMFPSGFIAGLLGRSSCIRRKSGEIYGLGTWGLSLIVTILLAHLSLHF